jgi:hypothetical protein
MTKQEERLADLRREVAALVPPELVEREMIRVLACVIDGAVRREVRLRAIIRYLLAERRAGEPCSTTPPLRH